MVKEAAVESLRWPSRSTRFGLLHNRVLKASTAPFALMELSVRAHKTIDSSQKECLDFALRVAFGSIVQLDQEGDRVCGPLLQPSSFL